MSILLQSGFPSQFHSSFFFETRLWQKKKLYEAMHLKIWFIIVTLVNLKAYISLSFLASHNALLFSIQLRCSTVSQFIYFLLNIHFLLVMSCICFAFVLANRRKRRKKGEKRVVKMLVLYVCLILYSNWWCRLRRPTKHWKQTICRWRKSIDVISIDTMIECKRFI